MIRRWRAPALTAVASAFAGAMLMLQTDIWNGYESSTDHAATFSIEDGSKVTLFPASLIRTRFSDRIREMKIDRGGAMLSVARDAARPFGIDFKGGSLEARAARFAVTASEQLTRIHVEEGAVRVRTSRQTVILQARSHAQIRADGDIDSTWQKETQLVAIRDGTLDQIAANFNRKNALQILVEGTACDLKFTGMLDLGDAESFIQVLNNLPEVTIRIGDGVAIVRARRDTESAGRCLLPGSLLS